MSTQPTYQPDESPCRCICFVYVYVILAPDVEHSVDVGGAADGPAPVPLALPVEHARAVPPVRVGVRLDEKGGWRVCHVLGIHLWVPSNDIMQDAF